MASFQVKGYAEGYTGWRPLYIGAPLLKGNHLFRRISEYKTDNNATGICQTIAAYL
jgi:hypothetical protein